MVLFRVGLAFLGRGALGTVVWENGYSGINYRTNVCNKTSGVWDGVSLNHSLAGLHLQALGWQSPTVQAFYDEENSYLVNYNEALDRTFGIQYEIMEAMADLGGFTYAMTLRNRSDPANNRSYISTIQYMAEHYDIAMHSTTQTADRSALGLLQPYAIFDESPWLVTKTKNIQNNPFRNRNAFFAFASPLSWVVWLVLLSSSVCTGFVYRFFERRVEMTDAHNIAEATYLSMLNIMGVGALRPVTTPGKVLGLSWGFLVLIVVASYTANLAAVLVVDNSNSAMYSSIDDAIEDNADICVQEGWAIEDFLDSWYPEANKIATDDPWGDLDRGTCQAIVAERIEYDKARVNSEYYTKSCRITRVDEALAAYGGGWMVYADYTNKCSAFISSVLNVLFLEFDDVGELDEVTQEYLAFMTDKQCKGSLGGDATTLTMGDLAGVFILHGCAVALALVVYVYVHWNPQSPASAVSDFLETDTPEGTTDPSESILGTESPIKRIVSGSTLEVKRLRCDVKRATSQLDTIEAKVDAKLDRVLGVLGLAPPPPKPRADDTPEREATADSTSSGNGIELPSFFLK